MSDLTLTVRDASALGSGARAYRAACAHGVSSALLLPGRKPLADLAVFDFLSAGHRTEHRCQCLPGTPVPAASSTSPAAATAGRA